MTAIELCPLEAADIDETFVAWHQLPHTEYYSSSRRTFTKETLLRELQQGQDSGNLFQYGIHHVADQRLIGVIKVGPINWHHKIGDMATFIGDTRYLGMGLATEAIRAANQLAFEMHGLRKLYSGMYRQNVGSVKAYCKAGWVIEGVLKHQYLHDGSTQDRILVACFNPAIYTDDYAQEGLYSFDQLYPQ